MRPVARIRAQTEVGARARARGDQAVTACCLVGSLSGSLAASSTGSAAGSVTAEREPQMPAMAVKDTEGWGPTRSSQEPRWRERDPSLLWRCRDQGAAQGALLGGRDGTFRASPWFPTTPRPEVLLAPGLTPSMPLPGTLGPTAAADWSLGSQTPVHSGLCSCSWVGRGRAAA